MHTSRSGNRPRVAVTMGDPSGIGPEVTIKALASSKVMGLADFFVIGDRFVMDSAAKITGFGLSAELVDLANVAKKGFAYGRVNGAYGSASMEYIDRALEMLAAGSADCVVTAPVNKASVRSAGFRGFRGHTEYLAEHSGERDYAMMFVGSTLKVTLVTRHVPIENVSGAITADKVYRAIMLTDRCLKRCFKLRRPRIAVCGLNPHAGEEGAFGSQERRLIAPAVRKAAAIAKGARGPIPADAAFYDCVNGKFDSVVAMYHDQGLVPFKMLHFRDGVNMTIGLPFVRTSPDHGTAFDIAGRGIADPASMIEAIRLACRLSSSA